MSRLARARRSCARMLSGCRPRAEHQIVKNDDKYKTTQDDRRDETAVTGAFISSTIPCSRTGAGALRMRRVGHARWRGARSPPAGIAIGLGAGVVAGWQLHAVARRRAASRRRCLDSSAARPTRTRGLFARCSPSGGVGCRIRTASGAWVSKRLGALRRPSQQSRFSLGRRAGLTSRPTTVPRWRHFTYQTEKGAHHACTWHRVRRESETAFRYSVENVKVFYWIDRKLAYALSRRRRQDDLLKSPRGLPATQSLLDLWCTPCLAAWRAWFAH